MGILKKQKIHLKTKTTTIFFFFDFLQTVFSVFNPCFLLILQNGFARINKKPFLRGPETR